MGTGNQGEAGVLYKEALFAMEDTGTDRCCQRIGCETPEAYGGHDHRCAGLFALLGDSRVPLYSATQQGYCGGDRECAAYVRRTAEHTERQERTGSRGRTTGSARTAAEMGTGFLGAYSYQDASGFHAYHL